MIIDGKKIRDEIEADLVVKFAELFSVGEENKKLAFFVAGDDVATKKFVALKKKFAEDVGVGTLTISWGDCDGDETSCVVAEIERLARGESVGGIVVQLPLPKHIDTDIVLLAIPAGKDVDALGSAPIVMAPVAEAVKEILERNKIDVKGRKALIIGYGRLVGKPCAKYLRQSGAEVEVIDKEDWGSGRANSILREADVIVTGVGIPVLIKPEMIKQGVVLIDAGTSELDGKLVGDADQLCADRASLFTPVPGGVGPITVALLFRNFYELIAKND